MQSYLEKFSDEVKGYTQYIGFRNFNYAINISLKNKYIYVETPKVACSSIKLVLQKMELENGDLYYHDFNEIHETDYSPLLRPLQIYQFHSFIKQTAIVKFCFVRNPYERLLSAYLDKIKGNQPQKKAVLTQLGCNPSKIDTELSFSDFVKSVAKQPVERMNPHWRIQYYQTMQDMIRYDFIGKLESFNDDFKKIMTRINPDFQEYWSEERRHQTGANENMKNYYTEELRDLVYTKYKKDFEFFGYDPVLSETSHETPNELAGEHIHNLTTSIKPSYIWKVKTLALNNLRQIQNIICPNTGK